MVLAAAAGPLVAGRPWKSELNREAAIRNENDREAGLWFFSPQRQARLVSRSPRGDRIGADAVYAVVDDPDGKRRWLATDDGLAVLDADDRVIALLDRDDGLLANRLTGGARLDGRLYFSAAWGDCGGGLAVFDPQTAVLTGRFVSDGLASNKLASVEQAGHRLKLLYGAVYNRYGRGERGQAPPGAFDPRTGAVEPGDRPRAITPGGPPLAEARAGRAAGNQRPATAPLSRRAAPRRAAPRRQDLSLRRTRTGNLQLRATAAGAGAAGTGRQPGCRSRRQAAGRGQAGPSDDRLARGDASRPEGDESVPPGPRLATVLRMGQPRWPEFVPVLAAAVRDPHLRPRATAVALLSLIDDDAAIAAIRPATGDRDPYLRAVATLALLRHGQLPTIDRIKEMLEGEFGNFPFDAESILGVMVDRERVEGALAPHADEAIFRLLLEDPPHLVYYPPLPPVGTGGGPGLVPKSLPSAAERRQPGDAVSPLGRVVAAASRGGRAAADRL